MQRKSRFFYDLYGVGARQHIINAGVKSWVCNEVLNVKVLKTYSTPKNTYQNHQAFVCIMCSTENKMQLLS